MWLTHEEVRSLIEWYTLHITSCRVRRYGSVEFVQSSASGIGTNTYVRCLCGMQEDITDYRAW